MKTALKMFVVLTLISLISGGLLATLDGYTAPRIAENRLKDLKASIAEVMPSYDSYEELRAEPFTIYIGKKANSDQPVGLAFRVVGSGFQGKISMMVGMKPDFTQLTGMKVLEQVETPGLGTKIVVDPSRKNDPFWFPDQFKTLKIHPKIEMVKNIKASKDNEIQAISGATISSNAVVRILNEQILLIKKAYENK